MVSTRISQPGRTSAAAGGQGHQQGGDAEADVGADHEDIAVGEVEQHQDRVDHGVAQGDQGVEAAPLQGVDHVLEKIGHGR